MAGGQPTPLTIGTDFVPGGQPTPLTIGTDFVPGGGPCGGVVGGAMIAATMHQGMMAPQGLQLQDFGHQQGLPLQEYDSLPMTPRDGD
jgi:hypothetical protein